MLFNREQAKQFREDLDEALKAVAQKWEGQIEVSGVRYGNSMEAKIELTRTDAKTGVPMGKDADAYKRYYHRFALPPDGLGRSFLRNGESWTIIGLRPRSKTHPVLGQNAAGKVMRFNPIVVDNGLEKK